LAPALREIEQDARARPPTRVTAWPGVATASVRWPSRKQRVTALDEARDVANVSGDPARPSVSNAGAPRGPVKESVFLAVTALDARTREGGHSVHGLVVEPSTVVTKPAELHGEGVGLATRPVDARRIRREVVEDLEPRRSPRQSLRGIVERPGETPEAALSARDDAEAPKH
jgi:hypothetical protein